MAGNNKREKHLAEAALLLASILWGTGFVIQRLAMEHVVPIAFMGLRFTFGALLLLPLALSAWRREKNLAPAPGRPAANNVKNFLIAGALMAVGSTLQQYGLIWTTVSKAGFITSLYVVLVPLLLFAGGRKLGFGETLGAVLALAGLYIMSVTERFSLSAGDTLVFLGAFVWAAHMIWLGRVSPRMNPFILGAGQALTAGILGIAAMLAMHDLPTWEELRAAWWLIALGGLLSVTLGFTLQVYGQKKASPPVAALIMQMEAVFAAISGWLFLHEGMTGRMLAGAAVMFAGVLVNQLLPGREARPATSESGRFQG